MERRELLRRTLFGAGTVGLRSLATGLPASMFLRPPSAWAQSAAEAKMLILVASQAGDPVNANCPGAYVDGIVHPTGEDFLPTEIRLGDRNHIGARAWTQLPQRVLDRTCFIHHGTYTNAHGNHSKVMTLMGAVRRNEMLISAFAKRLRPAFQSVQTEPVNVGAPLLSFEGRRLALLRPQSVKAALASNDDALARLQSLRDAELDAMYASLKVDGTPQQIRMMDRFAQTRSEARNISEDLLDRLDAIQGNGDGDQVRAAAVLAAMNVSPALALNIRFGRDNHNDGNLADEVEETVAGVGHLASLHAQLEELGLADKVVVATLNVFGRTLSKKGTQGRDHNAHHHVMVVSGPGVRPGVIGGIQPRGNDWGSTGIESGTGVGTDQGDIPYEQTLESTGKTLGRLLGLPEEALNEDVDGGKVISAALA
ncbi:MAG: DUF1501 domain-containing protein [Myxococcota bacterium]